MKKIYVLLILLLLQNCTTTLLKNAAPVTTPTNWLFEISEVYSTSQYVLERRRYSPREDNERMMVVEIKATNRDLVKRVINFNASILVTGKMIRKAAVVAKTENMIFVVRDLGIAEVEPNQSVKRDMVFVFPEKMKPEKLFIQNVGEINLLEQQNPVPR
ncbi:hypothetical protein [Leptospira interrogans]|uniref:hypothetical protein n=1 Tax=Leptospira interrogans TaxID=173 RepID=UPI0007731E79|nr:hypothetical protein [Leptospira interrogans]UMQ57700.1 hypothetical protein FH585_15840 [Leptospira interrogans]UMQ57718.1 hypothetical protein FH585_15940 [Leptospira interrogans]UNE65014.1 hypothetical protein FH588_01640 [Leptospira interrogans]UNE65032.1 hypothetical protein FH588_01740 [Leptospira interrogans]